MPPTNRADPVALDPGSGYLTQHSLLQPDCCQEASSPPRSRILALNTLKHPIPGISRKPEPTPHERFIMQVSEQMTATVHTCHHEDSLNLVAQRLWEQDCGSLPVVDGNGRVCGMITDRDVCMAAYTTGQRLSDLTVGDVMATHVASIHPGQTLRDAELVMRGQGARRLPVVDDDNFLQGIITCNDLIRWVDDGGSAGKLHHDAVHLVRTLAMIGKPRRGLPVPSLNPSATQLLPPVPLVVTVQPSIDKITPGAQARHSHPV
jgi:CBS domain-containing protein